MRVSMRQRSRQFSGVMTTGLVGLGFAVAVFAATQPQRPSEIPVNAIPQNAPCPDQPKSLTELTKAFNNARIPSRSEMSGTWIGIGTLTPDGNSLDCSGLKRVAKLYEQVMLANGYSLEMHIVGTFVQKPTMTPDRT